jgi:hypothetical protein
MGLQTTFAKWANICPIQTKQVNAKHKLNIIYILNINSIVNYIMGECNYNIHDFKEK